MNHLAYIDDIIIFLSPDERSLKLIMDTLAVYEDASGQKVNKEMSAVYMHHLVPQNIVDKYDITKIPKGEFTFTYLAVPI